MDFDLHRLRLLRELRHRGTIAAVAAALSYNPASISQQLRQLQREVGTTLLEPHGRGVRLTPAADLLVTHVEAIFDRLEQAEADLARSHREVLGTVRVAAFQTVLINLFPNTLSLLRQRHPGLRVEIFDTESEVSRARLLPHDFDLVIDEVYPGRPLSHSKQLSQELLITEPLRLAYTPRMGPKPSDTAAKTAESLRLYDFATSPWVMEPPGSPAREWAVGECRAAGFEPDIQFESPDVVVHERLVATGHAIAFLPDCFRAPPGSATLRTQIAADHERRIVVTTRGVSRQHPAIRAVTDALRASVEGATLDRSTNRLHNCEKKSMNYRC